MPLSTRRRPVDVYDDEVALLINQIIDQANQALESTLTGSKLQFCIDLAKQNRRNAGEENQKSRDVECYFLARTGTIEEEPEILRYLTSPGMVWAGGFFDHNWASLPSGAPHPGGDRVAKWPRHDDEQPVLGSHDSARRWAANGAADRLRCSDLAGGELQQHRRPIHDRIMTAFPRMHID
jgi:hypothetical protein